MPMPLQARLLPPSFLEPEPWLWLELLLRTSAPPGATTFTITPFPRDPSGQQSVEYHRIQPFVPPKLKAPSLVEVRYYSDSGEHLTTMARMLVEFGQR